MKRVVKTAVPLLLAIPAVTVHAQTMISSSSVSAAPQETVLYSFSYTDGAYPFAARAGNLYGTTNSGGASGDGTVFKVPPSGTETVLYAFFTLTGCADGALPCAALIADRAGNLYGTTNVGGASNKGTVFKVTPAGTETVLHSFAAPLMGPIPSWA